MKTWPVIASTLGAVVLISSGRTIQETVRSASPDNWVAAYESDFKNMKATADNWCCRLGKMKIDDGKVVLLPIEKRKRAWFILDPLTFPDSFRVEVIGSVSPGNKPQLLSFGFCLSTFGDDTGSGYMLQFGANNNTCSLLKKCGKVIGSTINTNARPEAGRAYNFAVERVGGRISLSVDGAPVFSYDDPAPLGDVTCDSISLFTANCSMTVEKVTVYARKDHPEDVFAPMIAPAGGPPVTIKGALVWENTKNSERKDAGDYQVIYAIEGTSEINSEWGRMMRDYWPGDAMDCDQAKKLNDEVVHRFKYYLAPHQTAARAQRASGRYGATPMEVSGAIVEKDGRRWIVPTGMQKTKINYPAKMLAPDKPLVMPGKEPLVLKINDKVSLKCVLLPAGRYLQGAPYYQRVRCACEDPHEVVLTKPFWMAETPVTQEIFESMMGTNPCRSNAACNVGPLCPVEQVPYADIETFCRLLSEKTRRKVRLATHGEWEFAGRVGTSNPCFPEKYKDQISNIGADTQDDTYMRNCPVKSAQPNAWGLYDMLTRAEHVLSDWGGPNSHQKEVDPSGPLPSAAWNKGVHLAIGYHQQRPDILGGTESEGQGWEALAIFRVVVEATPQEIAQMETAGKK